MDITEDTPIACLTVKQFIDVINNCLNPSVYESTKTKEKELLDIADMIKLTGYSRDSLYKQARERKIPHYRFADTGKLWFKRTEIMEWMQDQKVKTISEINNGRRRY